MLSNNTNKNYMHRANNNINVGFSVYYHQMDKDGCTNILKIIIHIRGFMYTNFYLIANKTF